LVAPYGILALSAWQNQQYGPGALPPEEESMVDAFNLTPVEQFATININSLFDSRLIEDSASWDILESICKSRPIHARIGL